jgi:predicted lipoprotein with Yx(FWY)xxD motif
MGHLSNRISTGTRRAAILAAGLLATAVVGIAEAGTPTLQVGRGAKVTNTSGATRTETIVVNVHRHAVYTLSGDSPRHAECTRASGCFSVWPPLTVTSARSLTRAAGVPGKPGIWRRNGFNQVTLAGHPLYRYAGDSSALRANGEGIFGFGGYWHVVKAG